MAQLFSLGHIHTLMKKKRVIIWIVILLLASIAALEIFDCHPSFTIGHCRVRWNGVRHMHFVTDEQTDTFTGYLEKFSVYILGPITVSIRHD